MASLLHRVIHPIIALLEMGNSPDDPAIKLPGGKYVFININRVKIFPPNLSYNPQNINKIIHIE